MHLTGQLSITSNADFVALRPVCPIVDLPTIVQAAGTVA